MTREDSLKYAEAVKEYEKHKNHFYVLPHDGLNLFNYLKLICYDKSIFFIGIGCYIVGVLFLGGVFGFMTKSYYSCFKASAIFLLVFYVFSGIVNYFLYINYVDGTISDNFTGYFFLFVCVLGSWIGVHKYTGDEWLAICAAVMVLLFGVWFVKAMYFERDNKKPDIDDFDSEKNKPDIKNG